MHDKDDYGRGKSDEQDQDYENEICRPLKMKQGGDAKRNKGGNENDGNSEQIDEQAIPQRNA
jgi:hypothetical protein